MKFGEVEASVEADPSVLVLGGHSVIGEGKRGLRAKQSERRGATKGSGP